MIERQAFFEVMASFPSGVAIVTTVDPDGVPRGLTTTAVCSVSADLPTILVCVDLGLRTLSALRARRGFVVNFMGEGRSELCLLFASKVEDKFAHAAWRETASGPLLHEDVLAWAECSTMHELEVSTTCSSSRRSKRAGSSSSSSRRLCTTGARGASGRRSTSPRSPTRSPSLQWRSAAATFVGRAQRCRAREGVRLVGYRVSD